MLIEAGAVSQSGGVVYYADTSRASNWVDSGSLLDGDFDIVDGATTINLSRIMYPPGFLRLNDNPDADHLGDYFENAGNDLTVYVQTASDGVISIPVSGNISSSGNNWLNLLLPTAFANVFGSIADGERFIFVMARASSTTVDHAVDAGDASFDVLSFRADDHQDQPVPARPRR